jgi:hypothetical protein
MLATTIGVLLRSGDDDQRRQILQSLRRNILGAGEEVHPSTDQASALVTEESVDQLLDQIVRLARIQLTAHLPLSDKLTMRDRRLPRGTVMPFKVSGWVHGCPLTVSAETAEEAFATAIDWQMISGAKAVTIDDGNKRLTVAEFSWAMASRQIADTARDSRRTSAAYSI